MLTSSQQKYIARREAIDRRRKAKANARALRRIAKAKRREVRYQATLSRRAAKAARRNADKALRQSARDARRSSRASDKLSRNLLIENSRTYRAAEKAARADQRAKDKARRESARLSRKVGKHRTRSKDLVSFSYQNLGIDGLPIIGQSGSFDYPCDVLTDNTLKPCNLFREQVFPVSGSDRSTTGYSALYNNIGWTFVNWRATMSCWQPWALRLKRKKLATSNDANLLTAFAELDDTLAMFSTKLKSSASYGGVKWGWMPLISDISACNDAADRVKSSMLDGNNRSHAYRANDKFSVKSLPIVASYGTYVHTWDVEVKYRGTITYTNDELAFYDYMGFHPTPKLAWDLVPLSFALDWILPVGDMLKDLTPPKGWVKAANFTGWIITTATCNEKRTKLNEFYTVAPPSAKVKLTSRVYYNGVTLEEKNIRKPIEALKVPSMTELTDIAFLSDAFYNRAKALLSPHVYRKRPKF